MSCYKIIDWDSEFFGFPVAQLLSPEASPGDVQKCLSEMKAAGIRLVYSSGKLDRKGIEELVKLGGKYVDQKTIYYTRLDEVVNPEPDPRIVSYQGTQADQRLVQLSIDAGIYSRFNTDKQIGKEKFEELYRRWISQSVSRAIAKDVFVFTENETISGMITVGEKNGSGNIGLVAVDTSKRGAGIGVALVNHAKSWFYRNGFKDATVVTQGFNIPACKLYEKCGFSVMSSEAYFHFWL
jgi:dTDP-4-amino-4,6-dideoxy-D-galactose acyltransferase